MNQKQHENLDNNKFLKAKQNAENIKPLLFTVTPTVTIGSPQTQKNHARNSLQAINELQRPLLATEANDVNIYNETNKNGFGLKKATTDASLYSKDSKYNSQSLLSLSNSKKLSNGSLGTNEFETKIKRNSTNLDARSNKSGCQPYNFSLANLSGSEAKKSLPQFLINFPNITRKSSTHNLNYTHTHPKTNMQAQFYNFLERPTGWKCFLYHFTVYFTIIFHFIFKTIFFLFFQDSYQC